jgi:hypothetical protein
MKKQTFLLVAVLMLCAQAALAQNTGQITGRVADVAGGAIHGIEINVLNATSSLKVASDDNGEYQIVVPAGIYNVGTGKLPGFAATERLGVRVRSGEATRLNITPSVSREGVLCELLITTSPEKPKKQKKRQ